MARIDNSSPPKVNLSEHLRLARSSEILDPGPQFDFPGPGAARLAMQIQIGVGDRVRVEESVGAAFVGARIAILGDAAVDHDVADMDVQRLQFAREALREPAQRELA